SIWPSGFSPRSKNVLGRCPSPRAITLWVCARSASRSFDTTSLCPSKIFSGSFIVYLFFKKRPFVGRDVFSRSGNYRGTSHTGPGDLHQTLPVTHADQRVRCVARALLVPARGTGARREPDRRRDGLV